MDRIVTEAYYNLGVVNELLGNYEKAYYSYTESMKMVPKIGSPADSKGKPTKNNQPSNPQTDPKFDPIIILAGFGKISAASRVKKMPQSTLTVPQCDIQKLRDALKEKLKSSGESPKQDEEKKRWFIHQWLLRKLGCDELQTRMVSSKPDNQISKFRDTLKAIEERLNELHPPHTEGVSGDGI